MRYAIYAFLQQVLFSNKVTYVVHIAASSFLHEVVRDQQSLCYVLRHMQSH